jgi:hypothetical protein
MNSMRVKWRGLNGAAFRGPIFHNSSDRPSTIELELVEHESGAVLLEESRTPTFGRDDAGDCHYGCWTAEATL